MDPEIKIIGYCRACGKALDETTARHAQNTLFCGDHVPRAEAARPETPWSDPPSAGAGSGQGPAGRAAQPPPIPVPPSDSGSPRLAFSLGFIPGVGAIYNGQYAKGLVHVIIFGLLVSILGSGGAHGLEPLFGLMLAGFVFYMAFEAFHTAKHRSRGEVVDEFSGFLRTGGSHSPFPAGPIIMIAIGVIFLLNNLGFLQIRQIIRFWPALLIVGGLYSLVTRVKGVHRERE